MRPRAAGCRRWYEINDAVRRGDAARIGNVGLQIVRGWVMRFNARRSDGMIDGKAPGPQPKLNDDQLQSLAAIVEAVPTPSVHGVVRWRLSEPGPSGALETPARKGDHHQGRTCIALTRPALSCP